MPIFTRAEAPIVFYAHVPKTGGASIEKLFVRNGFSIFFKKTRPRRYALTVSPQHYHREIYERLVDLDACGLRFITVRHPVTRLTSEFMMREDDNDRFPDWLERARRRYARDTSTFDNHLRPQVDFHHPKLTVHKQEDGFGEGWAQALSEVNGLGFTVFSVARQNDSKGRRETFSSAYVDMAVAFCKKAYPDDFEVFGYPLHPERP